MIDRSLACLAVPELYSFTVAGAAFFFCTFLVFFSSTSFTVLPWYTPSGTCSGGAASTVGEYGKSQGGAQDTFLSLSRGGTRKKGHPQKTDTEATGGLHGWTRRDGTDLDVARGQDRLALRIGVHAPVGRLLVQHVLGLCGDLDGRMNGWRDGSFSATKGLKNPRQRQQGHSTARHAPGTRRSSG